jgi:hypothetical protein
VQRGLPEKRHVQVPQRFCLRIPQRKDASSIIYVPPMPLSKDLFFVILLQRLTFGFSVAFPLPLTFGVLLRDFATFDLSRGWQFSPLLDCVLRHLLHASAICYACLLVASSMSGRSGLIAVTRHCCVNRSFRFCQCYQRAAFASPRGSVICLNPIAQT